MKYILTTLLTFFLLTFGTFAQDENGDDGTEPKFLAFSQNMVPMSELQNVLSIGDSLMAPVLDELVDEGMLYGWGVLTHAWGDEYNYNIYYTAKDHTSFVKAFGEFVKRMQERHPEAWRETVQHFKAHKDNLYSIHRMYDGNENGN